MSDTIDSTKPDANINNHLIQFRGDSRYLLNLFASLENNALESQDININSQTVRLAKAELSGLVRKNGVLRRAVYEFPKTASSSWIKLNFGKASKENPDDILTYLRNIPWYITAKPTVEA